MTPGLAVIRSLLIPDATFREGKVYHAPRVVVLGLILFAALLAGTLSASFHANEVGRELLLQRELSRLDRLMISAPPEAQRQAAENVRRQLTRGSGIASLVGAAVGAVVQWLILFYEMWLLVLLLIQFAGGEERELLGKRHLRSQYLILMAMVPLILAEVIRAALLLSTSPDVYANAATFEDYQAAARVSLNLVEAAGVSLTERSPFTAFVVAKATSPFVWWAGYVFVAGAEEVFHLRARRATVVAVVVLLLMALQHTAIQAAGNLL
ncbi:MAG: YIP1 family protein [Spirochaetota bacterium]